MTAGSFTLGYLEREGVSSIARQRTITSAGSSQSTAAQIGPSSGLYIVAGATGTTAVRLPKTRAPRQIIVYSTAATNALPVYPPFGGTVNTGTQDAAFSATARTVYIFMSQPDGITWLVK